MGKLLYLAQCVLQLHAELNAILPEFAIFENIYFSESWQQLKQNSAIGVIGASSAVATAAATNSAAPKPIYPIKRFVRSQESGRGGVEDELDESPVCQRVYDVAVSNKVSPSQNFLPSYAPAKQVKAYIFA
jgi:hypothetical protein